MFLRTVELAFARFQRTRDPRALAIVFDRTAGELLRVARHLAAREVDAEDLLQATFLQVIEAADTHERGRPLLPWLLGILANQARSQRRRARRAPDPQRLRGEAVGDPLGEAEAGELGAAVAAAIDRLPEAYRPVLRMWLEHGLEAQEIARTLERPAGTVRAQVSRGLDLLRRALPHGIASGVAIATAGGRGLAAVRGEVLAVCKGTSTGLFATLALGGIVVLHHKLFAVGIAAAVVVATWSAFGGAPPAVVANSAGARGGTANAVADLPTAPTIAPAADGAPRAAVPMDGAAIAAATPPTATPDTGALEVELVAPDGRPLPAFGVALQASDQLGSFGRHARWSATDAAGIVRFAGLRPGTWHIDLDRLGAIAAGDVVAGATAHRRVEVPAGIRVVGAVVDENGRPVADADIAVHGSRFAAPTVARTDAQGHFAVEHLLPKLQLQARRAGYAASPVHLVEGNAGDELEIVLRLHNGGRRIAGRAVDAEGRALADTVVAVVDAAAVAADFWSREVEQRRPLYLRTDGDGAFAVDEVGHERTLVALLPTSTDAAACWTFVEAGAAEAFVELHAPRAAVITGHIVGCDDATQVNLQAFATDTRELGFLANLAALSLAAVTADGSYRLAGLPAGRCTITARRMFETLAETELVLQPGVATTWDVDLRAKGPGAPLVVRIRSAAPLPAGTMVTVVVPGTADGKPQFAMADAEGIARFARHDSAAVDVTIGVLAGGRSIVGLASRAGVQATEGEVVVELAADALPTRSIRGRLVDGAGAAIGNELVAVQRTDGAAMTRVEVTTDADGRFATIALPPGGYRVSRGGSFAMQDTVATATLTLARDEDLGDLRVAR